MKNVNITLGKSLSRRATLRNAGIAMGLPMLDAMMPAFAVNDSQPKAKRFLGVSLSLGLHGPLLVPETAGAQYEPSPYLQPLQDLRDDFTIVSGTSHPRVGGGHTAESSIFSACPNKNDGAAKNTISLDQLFAKHLGHETRFPSMVLNTGSSSSPSYTENGAMIPAMEDPVELFNKLFKDDSAKEQDQQAELIRSGRSIMDIVGDDAKSLQRELGYGDKEKLDHWFTSVRELEQRLHANEAWIRKPKPKVDAKAPYEVNRNNTISIENAMLEIARLAFQTDSTRFMTLHVPGTAKVNGVAGVNEGYHSLSHHGRDEEKIDQLAIVEQAVINEWADFLRRLKDAPGENGSLLDETMILLTSNLGNASSHDNRNMPVLFAGGGFKHGRHLAFDQRNNYPLPNLYLSALHRSGLEHEHFATSTGLMEGLA